MSKDFLNQGILGANIATAGKRGFRPVNTDNLPAPEYDGRYFETFPTVWASAYAFGKQLESGDRRSVEEWITIFLLHYFGVVSVVHFDKLKLETDYDRDVWLALSGTYPLSRDERKLESIALLQTTDKFVVGAYYPKTVFFPSRGRSIWPMSESLKPYLEEGCLAWEKASKLLLEDDFYRLEFHGHLRSIINVIPRRELKELIEGFCDRTFGAFHGEVKTLPVNPVEWEIRARKEVPPSDLLESYPLWRTNSNGGKTYYLVAGLDLSYQPPWMREKISPELPSPSDFLLTGPKKITIEFAGRKHICELREEDEAILLKDLFLSGEVAYCKIPKDSSSFKSHIILKHEIPIRDNAVMPNERAICLAPLRHDFLQHFSDIFRNLKAIESVPTPDGGAMWTFFLPGSETTKEVRWKCQGLMHFPHLAKTNTVSLFPPKVSPKWKLYIIHGTGDRRTSGLWQLIDENGQLGVHADLAEDEYLSMLHRDGDAPNRPRALLMRDEGRNERGILFLADLENRGGDSGDPATLAVDFGTSNTCLAVKAPKAEVLEFSVSPIQIWGPERTTEDPGFVPRKWGGKRGFFPTILLSRRSDENLPSVDPNDLKIEHLFKVDIPSLHKGLNSSFALGTFNKEWRTHSNLKWSSDVSTPWRSLFLELILFYAHAEVFFGKSSMIGNYVFTYPLAFSADFGNTYHLRAQEAIRKIRHYCYGTDLAENVETIYSKVDESTAIARSTRSDGVQGSLEVFLDIGGGTADVAIRHQNDFFLLDSVRVAGKSFFEFAKKNFDHDVPGATEFRKNLSRVIRGTPDDLKLSSIESDLANDLGAFYAIEVNELDEPTFREREENVLRQRLGNTSYQRYRSRIFFYHLIAYALLQSCATVINKKIVLTNGLNLVLGGNCWGLLLFADLRRDSKVLKSEAVDILNILKSRLLRSVTDKEAQYLEKISIHNVELLNEQSLGKAKTSVALGALIAGSSSTSGSVAEAAPFSGITLNSLRINGSEPVTIRWCDRWSLEVFKKKFGRFDNITSREFDQPDDLRAPIDPALETFTAVANSTNFGTDNSPEGLWMKINAQIVKSITNDLQTDGDRLNLVPVNYFLADILYPSEAVSDLLDRLSEKNIGGGHSNEQ